MGARSPAGRRGRPEGRRAPGPRGNSRGLSPLLCPRCSLPCPKPSSASALRKPKAARSVPLPSPESRRRTVKREAACPSDCTPPAPPPALLVGKEAARWPGTLYSPPPGSRLPAARWRTRAASRSRPGRCLCDTRLSEGRATELPSLPSPSSPRSTAPPLRLNTRPPSCLGASRNPTRALLPDAIVPATQQFPSWARAPRHRRGLRPPQASTGRDAVCVRQTPVRGGIRRGVCPPRNIIQPRKRDVIFPSAE